VPGERGGRKKEENDQLQAHWLVFIPLKMSEKIPLFLA